MINNVKVVPTAGVPAFKSPHSFKASFASIEEEKLLLTVVLPAHFSDAQVKGLAKEARECLVTLAKPSLNELLDDYSFSSKQATLEEHASLKATLRTRLNSIFTDLFYSVLPSPSLPQHRALPRLFPGFPLTQLSFSDKLLLDASEFVNAVYEDMS
jgi:hypothetical protein